MRSRRGEPVVERAHVGSAARPVTAATSASEGADARAASSASASPAVSPKTQAVSTAPRSARSTSRPANRATSVPAASARCRSAASEVAVRRGSTMTMRVPRAAFAAGEALEQHRMAPGGVAADQHDEVGLVEVLVAARHDVLAEGAHVPGDRGGHAQAGVGVDVGRADEALHELVGDVIVLGQELTRSVERDRLGAVLRDGMREGLGDEVERLVPRGAPPVDLRVEEAVAEAERLAERRAFRAQVAGVGRVRRVAGYGARRADHDAAADAAVGTGGAHGFEARRDGHQAASSTSASAAGSVSPASPASAKARPNMRRSRSGATSRPLSISCANHGPSATSP